jgi:hypothetical protein
MSTGSEGTIMNKDLTNGHARGFVQRIALVAMVVIGAFLVVLPLATNLPAKSSATGDMMAAFRPSMTSTSLAQSATDQRTMSAMGQQVTTAMLPALAAQLHMTPAQLTAYMAANDPAVANGLAQFGTIMPFFSNLEATMQAQQSNFQQADQIPTGFLAPTTMTWLFIVPGGVLLVFGLFGLVRPRVARRMVAASGAVGVVLVIGLLSVSMFAKATAADQLTGAFAPVFSAQNVQQARTDTNTVAAMATQFAQQAMPSFATALHMTPAQMNELVATRFPAVATGAAQLPQIVQRMEAATSLIEGNVQNYTQSASIPWSPGSMVLMFWFMMVSAVLAIAVAAGALTLTVRRHAIARVGAPRAASGAFRS